MSQTPDEVSFPIEGELEDVFPIKSDADLEVLQGEELAVVTFEARESEGSPYERVTRGSEGLGLSVYSRLLGHLEPAGAP